ncbi:hydroxymethylbilane synthase [Halostella sp. JP-L12]|uniref:hydroxymethylbilane synthase n=1 Tax=Halostella TaxID=1843185 RepID=UPI000EF7A27B|nr:MULTISPECIES: hydroxymethylbilane synthase [Halostella]NHN46127.1 hydroxymethylbilane synthase [Halostella sp. JP-L12]
MSKNGTIRLATRGSDLAMRQAATVKSALSDRRLDAELVEVETEGDRVSDELIHRLGKTGAFVRALDEQIVEGEVDAAVHSMKDMPTEQPDGLIVAGVPERAAPGDALVTPDGRRLEELPEGATVGTSSLRRGAQIRNARSDLTVEPLRGNVDTRIEKLLAPSLQREHEERTEEEKERKGNAGNDDYQFPYEQGVEEWFNDLSEIERRALEREVEVEYDAIVLAEAGLERSGLAHHVEYQRLPTDEFVPAPGQGALAVTALDGDVAEDLHTVLDHPRTRVETTVERSVLSELGGGCVAPIGVHAVIQGEYVHTAVQVFDREGEESVTATRDLPVQDHARAAREFARDLADRGAADLIAAARRESEEETEAKREIQEE